MQKGPLLFLSLSFCLHPIFPLISPLLGAEKGGEVRGGGEEGGLAVDERKEHEFAEESLQREGKKA